jgi:hypothetical protein
MALKAAREVGKHEIEASMQNIGQIATKLFTARYPHREFCPSTPGMSHRSVVYNVNGRIPGFCLALPDLPQGFDYVIVADDGGRLYFADTFDCRVQKLFPERVAVVALRYLYDREVFLALVID